MQQNTISFIGGGNMARSLIGGLIHDGYPARLIRVADPDQARLQGLATDFAVGTSVDNHAVAAEADVLVLAIKPQQMKSALLPLADIIRQRQPLVISIAAGLTIASLQTWLGQDSAIVRAMPNTPALVQSGATALIANTHVTDDQRDIAESIMRAVGLTLWLDTEDAMNLVTALSGSGPAYFFLIMEALENAATKLGLKREQARLLTLQTAFGAAKMALECEDEPARLRQNVTSPGGTTEQALAVLEDADLRRILENALHAAEERSRELSQLLGDPNG